MNVISVTRALAKLVLEQAEAYSWTIQGFGMMCLHMANDDERRKGLELPHDFRLNIWDSRFTVKDVSLMHNHPWHLESIVLSGSLENVRFVSHPTGQLYHRGLIKPGPGGGLFQDLDKVRLVARSPERYGVGLMYSQRADELHISRPTDGTVTMNLRQRVGEDVAMVCWPDGTEWVSAEPRPAEPSEVAEVARAALEKWQP